MGSLPPLIQGLMGLSRRWLLATLVGLTALLCSGCFQYDLTLHFDSPTHGYIQQQIQVSQRTVALTGAAVEDWIQTMKARVKALGGRVSQPAAERLTLTVPFSSGDDLTRRYQQLFQAAAANSLQVSTVALVPSHLTLDQANRFLVRRQHLVLDIDLRDLPQGDRPPGSGADQDWLDLRFDLQTPWGLSHITPGSLQPDQRDPHQTRWRLQPGQTHHIDVVFWLPSILGLGSVAIALGVIFGYFWKYGRRRSRSQP